MSVCLSVCPHYTRRAREELVNLRISGGAKGVRGAVCLHTPPPYFLVILTIFISLVVPPLPFNFFLISPFSTGASFLFHLVPTSKRWILSKKLDFEVLYPSYSSSLYSKVP
jgi:hypothetical protein